MRYFQDMTARERGLQRRLSFATGRMAKYEGGENQAAYNHWCREVAAIWREIDAL